MEAVAGRDQRGRGPEQAERQPGEDARLVDRRVHGPQGGRKRRRQAGADQGPELHRRAGDRKEPGRQVALAAQGPAPVDLGPIGRVRRYMDRFHHHRRRS